MINQQHTIEIYEPCEYQGPNPLSVEGVAVLPGPMRTNYYLLELVVPFVHESTQVRQLLVAPHYSGDVIDRAISSACTVNISCVLSGKHLDPDDTLWNFDNVHRWGVGKITPTQHAP
jgi:hypothetical protein